MLIVNVRNNPQHPHNIGQAIIVSKAYVICQHRQKL